MPASFPSQVLFFSLAQAAISTKPMHERREEALRIRGQSDIERAVEKAIAEEVSPTPVLTSLSRYADLELPELPLLPPEPARAHAPDKLSIDDIPVVESESLSLSHLPSHAEIDEPLETKVSEVDSLRLHIADATKMLKKMKSSKAHDPKVMAGLSKRIEMFNKILDEKASAQ